MSGVTALPEAGALGPAPPTRATRPASVFARRWRKFRSLKRGWYSFLALLVAYALSLASPLLVTSRALVVRHDGHLYFPAFGAFHEGRELGQRVIGEAQYRKLAEQYAREGAGDWVLLPPYPYHPNESLLAELPGTPPHAPSREHWLGTDDRGRDVLARLVHGLRISLTFAFGVVLVAYGVGVAVGATLGFFGGRVDIYGQRLVEIWSNLPFLYTVIIVGSVLKPNVFMLIVVLALFNWVGISLLVRGEFYRERSRDYVAAAVAQGEGTLALMFSQVLPNALTPVVTYAPFSLVGNISVLVALDFLGFGLRAPTPSWGELVAQGLGNLGKWHLVVFPLGALFTTLLLVVFVGEGVREAFDPKVHSRLR